MRTDLRIHQSGIGRYWRGEDPSKRNRCWGELSEIIDKRISECEAQLEQFWDDISGKSLDPDGVRAAREEEMAEGQKHGLYVKVPIDECFREAGKKPMDEVVCGHQQGR